MLPRRGILVAMDKKTQRFTSEMSFEISGVAGSSDDLELGLSKITLSLESSRPLSAREESALSKAMSQELNRFFSARRLVKKGQSQGKRSSSVLGESLARAARETRRSSAAPLPRLSP